MAPPYIFIMHDRENGYSPRRAKKIISFFFGIVNVFPRKNREKCRFFPLFFPFMKKCGILNTVPSFSIEFLESVFRQI